MRELSKPWSECNWVGTPEPWLQWRHTDPGWKQLWRICLKHPSSFPHDSGQAQEFHSDTMPTDVSYSSEHLGEHFWQPNTSCTPETTETHWRTCQANSTGIVPMPVSALIPDAHAPDGLGSGHYWWEHQVTTTEAKVLHHSNKIPDGKRPHLFWPGGLTAEAGSVQSCTRSSWLRRCFFLPTVHQLPGNRISYRALPWAWLYLET